DYITQKDKTKRYPISRGVAGRSPGNRQARRTVGRRHRRRAADRDSARYRVCSPSQFMSIYGSRARDRPARDTGTPSRPNRSPRAAPARRHRQFLFREFGSGEQTMVRPPLRRADSPELGERYASTPPRSTPQATCHLRDWLSFIIYLLQLTDRSLSPHGALLTAI